MAALNQFQILFRKKMTADDSIKNIISSLSCEGLHVFRKPLDQAKTHGLYNRFLSDRDFDEKLFIEEKDYEKEKNWLNSNPTNEFNFLNRYSDLLAFIEENSVIRSAIGGMLGKDYEIVIKELICGMPNSFLPDWVSKKIDNSRVPNLSAYIKPEYRDITYFRGIDFHQDMID